MLDDLEQLRQYAEHGSDDAFRVLVERHSGMVRGVALRIVRSEILADEITQAVFIILARKAARLSRSIVVAGWLHQTTRYVALETRRRERRRTDQEERMKQLENLEDGASVWRQIAPQLDEALGQLGQTDREAIVLRFLEQLSFAEVAQALRTTEAAAKMRVGRALDKLRRVLARRGAAVSAVALLGALTTHGASGAPAALAASASATALAPAATLAPSLTSLVKGTLSLMAWKKIQIGGAIALALLLAGGGGVMLLNRPALSNRSATLLTVQTFEPMAGEWEGTFNLEQDGNVMMEGRPCAMTVTTRDGGRTCEIELRTQQATGAAPMVQRYTHRIVGRGDRLFNVSDPASNRGDGEGEVTASAHDPVAGEWRVAMRFPLADGRGVMDGSWERRGDALVVRSHDEFFGPRGSSHLRAEIQLRRRTGAKANL